LEGGLLQGDFSARCLCAFTPREGTQLATEQTAYEKKLRESAKEQDADENDNEACNDVDEEDSNGVDEDGESEEENIAEEEETEETTE
jgi:hypothetical protein